MAFYTVKKAVSPDFGGVSLTLGNSKLGEGKVLNCSQKCGETCANDVPCEKTCYEQNYCFRPSVKTARQRNIDAWKKSPVDYFNTIRKAITFEELPLFRWHVGGDIPSQEYLEDMKQIAREFPNVRFLAYTKQKTFDYSNLPDNLVIIASQWGNAWVWGDNMPKSDIQFKGDTNFQFPANSFLCPANCEKCGHKCWEMVEGQTVIFNEH